jgi:hypothetical protein
LSTNLNFGTLCLQGIVLSKLINNWRELMDIKGKNALILGGFGLVGRAVCREMLPYEPARLVIGSLRISEAEQAIQELKKEFPNSPTKLFAIGGDIFLRSEWQIDNEFPRPHVLKDPIKRKRLVKDIIDTMDDEILESSMLYQSIMGTEKGLDGAPMDIVIDAINTSTAVAYQDIYKSASQMAEYIGNESIDVNWEVEIEMLLSSLYIPQLVRHIQIYHEAMSRAKTTAYIKVGTAGTGGMGLNIPYTHGEEKPSRVLMSKAALGGAQTLLTFLMARTPDHLRIVKEIKPTALIAWKEIGYGPIRRGGKDFILVDCPLENAVSIKQKHNLAPRGDFGIDTGEVMKAVFVNTGENGLFAGSDFKIITSIGQMQFVTPEEIGHNVILELIGSNTGKDLVGALDGAVMGSTFRAGFLRQSAINKIEALEAVHGESIAFEILGPPRMSKLMFEAYLLKLVYKEMGKVLEITPEEMAIALESEISTNTRVRQEIITVGLPILLPDGESILRGPVVKSKTANLGWVDLTADNMAQWQKRIKAIREMIDMEVHGETSSLYDRAYPSIRNWNADTDHFDVGEITAWILGNEDKGKRGKP